MKKPPLPRLWIVPTPKLPKPPWQSQNMRDVEWMKAWVCERLHVRELERTNREIKELYKEFCDHGGVDFDPETGHSKLVRPKLEDLIDQAWYYDDMEPLREYFRKINPKLADLIHPRKRAQGERGFTRNAALEYAVKDVHYVRRELWPQECGNKNRKRDNPPSAEEIVAEFYNLDHDDYEKLVSRSGKNFARKSKI